MNWPSIWKWLKEDCKRITVVPVFISVVSLCLTTVSLYYVVSNYHLQISSSRPDLVSNGAGVYTTKHPEEVYVTWLNVGKKPARRGEAKLFTIDERGAGREQMAHASIIGAGISVFPGYGGQAFFTIDMQRFLGKFLVCTTYFDDTGTLYEQSFIFRRRETQPNSDTTSLDEIESQSNGVCQ